MAGRDVEELEDLEKLLGGKGVLSEFDLGQAALGEAQDLAESSLGQAPALPKITQLAADEASFRGFRILARSISQIVCLFFLKSIYRISGISTAYPVIFGCMP
jgi:hypothetical protein